MAALSLARLFRESRNLPWLLSPPVASASTSAGVPAPPAAASTNTTSSTLPSRLRDTGLSKRRQSVVQPKPTADAPSQEPTHIQAVLFSYLETAASDTVTRLNVLFALHRLFAYQSKQVAMHAQAQPFSATTRHSSSSAFPITTAHVSLLFALLTQAQRDIDSLRALPGAVSSTSVSALASLKLQRRIARKRGEVLLLSALFCELSTRPSLTPLFTSRDILRSLLSVLTQFSLRVRQEQEAAALRSLGTGANTVESPALSSVPTLVTSPSAPSQASASLVPTTEHTLSAGSAEEKTCSQVLRFLLNLAAKQTTHDLLHGYVDCVSVCGRAARGKRMKRVYPRRFDFPAC